MKGFYQQPSNIIRGVTDTVQDESGIMGSFDMGQLRSSTPQKLSGFKREEASPKSKDLGVTGKPNVLSPRSVQNSSNMQRAAILNNASGGNSPSSFTEI